jgi:DNA-binding response OmpR family regulator
MVDDDDSLCRILKRNLQARGVEAHCAESVAAALQAITEERPDLLVLDINLPDRSGWELLRSLRARSIQIPAIVISAARCSPDRLDEFQPIANLPKPFPLEALLRLIVNEEPARAG